MSGELLIYIDPETVIAALHFLAAHPLYLAGIGVVAAVILFYLRRTLQDDSV